MLDIHTHILPYVDDGALDIEEAKYLLSEEIKNGVDKIVLTPHQTKETLDKSRLEEMFGKYKEEIEKTGIKAFLGSEVYYYRGLIDDLKKDLVLTINNSKYILVEFSTFEHMPIADIVYDMTVNGYIPIVAHVERYSYLTQDDIKSISNSGGLLQVNASAFEKRKTRRLVKFMLKNGILNFVASDCHGMTRGVDFKAAKKYISKKFKNEYNKIFESNIV